MELTAAIQGLRAFTTPTQMVVFCDSQYVRMGITEWIATWKKKNWQRPTGVLANVDLWKELDRLNTHHRVTWKWVRGHGGNPFNEQADRLAVEARLKFK
jgi:ribonuclease HI